MSNTTQNAFLKATGIAAEVAVEVAENAVAEVYDGGAVDAGIYTVTDLEMFLFANKDTKDAKDVEGQANQGQTVQAIITIDKDGKEHKVINNINIVKTDGNANQVGLKNVEIYLNVMGYTSLGVDGYAPIEMQDGATVDVWGKTKIKAKRLVIASKQCKALLLKEDDGEYINNTVEALVDDQCRNTAGESLEEKFIEKITKTPVIVRKQKAKAQNGGKQSNGKSKPGVAKL